MNCLNLYAFSYSGPAVAVLMLTAVMRFATQMKFDLSLLLIPIPSDEKHLPWPTKSPKNANSSPGNLH